MKGYKREQVYPWELHMIREMLELQKKEDVLLQKERGVYHKALLRDGNYFFALLDEIGEFVHEVKPDWCWWKKTVGEIDQERIMEEFSDMTHFILSACLWAMNGDISEVMLNVRCLGNEKTESEILVELLDTLKHYNFIKPEYFVRNLFSLWIALCDLRFLSFEADVYEPYIEKNAINRQRVVDGY